MAFSLLLWNEIGSCSFAPLSSYLTFIVLIVSSEAIFPENVSTSKYSKENGGGDTSCSSLTLVIPSNSVPSYSTFTLLVGSILNLVNKYCCICERSVLKNCLTRW